MLPAIHFKEISLGFRGKYEGAALYMHRTTHPACLDECDVSAN
jgi:hypothetical protein